MIVNKQDKSYQTRSDMPNTNWLDDNWYLVDDNSELAQKIKKIYPRFNFVLDDIGNLVDIIEMPKTEEELREERKAEIHLALQELDKIINRATEDLYDLTNAIPYTTVQEAMEQKEALRAELQGLNSEVII